MYCIALAAIVRWLRAVEVVDKEIVASEMFATGLPKDCCAEGERLKGGNDMRLSVEGNWVQAISMW
jgi:hypothetical protein